MFCSLPLVLPFLHFPFLFPFFSLSHSLCLFYFIFRSWFWSLFFFLEILIHFLNFWNVTLRLWHAPNVSRREKSQREQIFFKLEKCLWIFLGNEMSGRHSFKPLRTAGKGSRNRNAVKICAKILTSNFQGQRSSFQETWSPKLMVFIRSFCKFILLFGNFQFWIVVEFEAEIPIWRLRWIVSLFNKGKFVDINIPRELYSG